ncbi:hypothetical protein ACFSZS_16145 [Seohaeicola zhoushanensis]
MPPPVSLGRTILIDMQTPWWKSWLGRHRTPEALEQTYRPLIEIEVKGITEDVRACIETALEETTAAMALFLEEQGQIAAAIAERNAIQTASLAETRRLVAALRQLHGRIRGESDKALPGRGQGHGIPQCRMTPTGRARSRNSPTTAWRGRPAPNRASPSPASSARASPPC